MLDDVGYLQLQKVVKRLIGIDLSSYREGQMRRRIEALVRKLGVPSYAEYGRLLEKDSKRLQEFRDYITINVTEFFRDVDRFKFLETRVLPELLASKPSLKVWSAACSIGAEPYSVAILLRELAPRGTHKILATDVDQTILDRAKRGTGYATAELRNVSKERLGAAFTKQPDGTYNVLPELKRIVEYRQHDLLGPAPGMGFDLILCRNVVIYFTDDAKKKLYDGFVRSLRPEGVLFVGGTEIVAGSGQLGLSTMGPSFYRKLPEAAPKAVAGGFALGRR